MTLDHAASDYTAPKNEDSQLKELHQAGVLPPWLWFWLVTYLLILPSVLIYHWQETIQPMLSPQPLPAGIGGPHTAIMLVLPGFTELLPIAMLLIGVVYVFMPHYSGPQKLDRGLSSETPRKMIGVEDEQETPTVQRPVQIENRLGSLARGKDGAGTGEPTQCASNADPSVEEAALGRGKQRL